MSSGSTTWTAGSSRRSSSSSKAGPSGSRPSPPPWARIPVRSKRCTSRFSCNAASWPARRAAAAPLEPRTSILGSLRPEPRTSKRSSTGRQSRYRTSDFNYSLPAGRIAQHPLPDRAASRLLVLDRSTGAIRHAQFRDIVELVAPEDVLVLNVSRVIPARLHGTRETGNVAELRVVRELPDGVRRTRRQRRRTHRRAAFHGGAGGSSAGERDGGRDAGPARRPRYLQTGRGGRPRRPRAARRAVRGERGVGDDHQRQTRGG